MRRSTLVALFTLAPFFASVSACDRTRAPRPDAGFDRTLTEGPLETVPRAIGGGPPTGTVSRDDARERIAAARCRVAAACNAFRDELTSDGPDVCSARGTADLALSCEQIDAARLDACLQAINGCDHPALPTECSVTALCP